ncbi:GTPase HflX [Acutalibacter caecimuris]|uniref:GTPase HflX n=1 Tax=Acutalibacter caecimuris TaxID=3093657 RepID=UPI002AC9295F|nr:GTPase HflX [Acutalibacter sp. M00118]
MFENEQNRERALLVALDTGEYDAETSLDELCELAESAGADPAFTLTQKRPSPEAATCVGTGMAAEAADLIRREELDICIFDRELTPTQIRNLEELFGVRVIDRTMLILDIFAQRARSREGKLQVELAQLRYMLPRLTGKGAALSRLGGGIGTRGPGETKLETDRRHIRRRIGSLKEQLAESEAARAVTEKRRKKNGVVTVALVGYTNAGKSTLMNRLTQAGVLAEDKLFATLDPTARALKLPGGKTIMLIDTVGLVRRLPHHLVEAFKSTLEQAATADILLNICDASSPACGEHLRVTEELLQSLGTGESPVIPVLNKWDKVADMEAVPRLSGAVHISALHGEGIDQLMQAMEDNLSEKTFEVELLLPFAKSGLAAKLRDEGAVLNEEYTPEGLRLTVRVDQRLYGPVKAYDINKLEGE